jgi:hypothetical protein
MTLPHQIETALAQDHGPNAAAALLAAQRDTEIPGDTLREIGEAAARQYREFHTHAVHQFLTELEKFLPTPAYQAVLAPLTADIEATRVWDRCLDEMASERLINGLVDKIKTKDMQGAEASAMALIMGVPEESRPQRARFIGNMLGGLLAEKDRAHALVKSMSRNPLKFGLDPITVTDVEEEYARASAATATRERAQGGASRQNLTDAAVELSRQLPGRNVLHEPTEDEVHVFDRAVRAIVRSCLLSPQHDKFNEATRLLVEFSPKEVSAAGAMAGIEQRLYASLGRTARITADRVFQAIGQHPRVIHPYMEFTRQHLHERIGQYCVETLGLFRNADTVPFLRETLTDKSADARTEALFALGTIGTDAAFEELIGTLKQNTSGRVIEGEPRREAFTIISALGRMIRATPDVNRRSQLIKQIINALPKDDLEFLVRAVLNFFTGKQDGMDPAILRWGAQVAVTALWSTDRPELARAGRTQPLGFRQPLIDVLGRLAPFTMGTINETATKYAKLYSGAYLAMGEFYAKNPDPSQVPVIQQMLFNTALHDDTKKSEYVKQTVFDATAGAQQDLTKDQVIAALAGALEKIDSDEARQAMSDMFQQVQNGQLPQPGPETAAILVKAHMAAQKASGQATMAPGGPQFASRGAGSTAADTGPAPTPVSEEDLQFIEDLKSRYLFASNRRAKKVAAMNALGNRKIAAAASVIVPHVNDSDAIIASAAQMALQDMTQQPVARQTQETVYRAIIDGIESGDNVLKVKLGEVLTKMGPTRPPLSEVLEKAAARESLPPAARAVLEKVMAGPGAAGGPAHKRQPVVMDEQKLGAAAGYMPSAGGTKGAEFVSDLDKKRAYMQARQDWIRGGKRGPEPKPPE